LTGNMSRYMWSFDGIKFADAQPLHLRYGERVRINLVNDTMMHYPIHLHGMWSDVELGDGQLLRKKAVSVKPGEMLSYLVRAGARSLHLRYGERVRISLVNDTSKHRPIHLHGKWSDVELGDGQLLRKHTVSVKPGEMLSYRVRADALGRWAFHCHLLYHMEAGMFREVRVSQEGR